MDAIGIKMLRFIEAAALKVLCPPGVEGGVATRLSTNAVSTLVIKVISYGLAFASSFVLARHIGAEGYGEYAFIVSIISVLSIPVGMGLSQLLIRDVAMYCSMSSWGLIRGLLLWADRMIIMNSFALGVIAAAVVWFSARHQNLQWQWAFFVALLALPLIALGQMRQSALQGLNRIVSGLLPLAIIQPMVFLFLSVGYFLWGSRVSLDRLMIFYFVSAGFSLVVSDRLLRTHLPSNVRGVSPMRDTRRWIHGALALVVVEGLSTFSQYTDVILLKAFAGPGAVGIYKVCAQLASVIAFLLNAVNTALAPVVADLYAKGSMDSLQRVLVRSARFTLLASLPLLILFMAGGEAFLDVFGPEFKAGFRALAILGIGQLVNVATGSVGLVLIMTRHEREVAKGLALASVLNIMLNVLLIPLRGIEGAAIASTATVMAWNIVLAVKTYRKLGIFTTVWIPQRTEVATREKA